MTSQLSQPLEPHNRNDDDSWNRPTANKVTEQESINVELLAERVYKLMHDDVRRERARRGWD